MTQINSIAQANFWRKSARSWTGYTNLPESSNRRKATCSSYHLQKSKMIRSKKRFAQVKRMKFSTPREKRTLSKLAALSNSCIIHGWWSLLPRKRSNKRIRVRPRNPPPSLPRCRSTRREARAVRGVVEDATLETWPQYLCHSWVPDLNISQLYCRSMLYQPQPWSTPCET